MNNESHIMRVMQWLIWNFFYKFMCEDCFG